MAEDLDFSKEELEIHKNSLGILNLQKAKHGSINAPLHILHQIDDEENAIKRLEQENVRVVVEREGMRPDLISAPKEPQNLPAKAFFVGREKVMGEIMSALDPQERTWIVSIDGVGGAGKTALALEIGYRCWEEKRFEVVVWTEAKSTYLTADGIRKEKPALTCLDDLLNEIAKVFGAYQIIKLRQDEKRLDVYDLLKSKKTLLIIDNLETLSEEECGTIGQFLRRTPNTCKIIITSRYRLGEGERVVRLKEMKKEDALQLLSHECKKKDVSISSDQQIKIYERTGGIPLAMVWVIGQMSVKGLSPERVIERLGQAVDSPLLEFCFRDSLKLLDRDTDRLFRLMAVFAAPVNMEVLKATSGITDQLDLEDALARLIKLSLINKEDDSYYLLPLTKTFALQELDKDTIFKKDAGLKVAKYYLEYSLKNGGYENHEGFKRLNKKLANILSSFNWCYESSEWQMVIKFNDGLYNFLSQYGYWDERIELGKRCLEAAKKLEDKKEYARCAIYSLGWIYQQRHEIDEAKRILEEGLRLAEELDNRGSIATAKSYLGNVAKEEGDYGQAEALYNEAFEIFKCFGAESINVASTLIDLGSLAKTQGDYTNAKRYYQESLELYQKLKNEGGIAASLGNLGEVAYDEKDYEKVKEYYHESMKIAEETGNVSSIANQKYGLGMVEEKLENYPQARKFFEEALENYRRLGVKKMIEAVQEAIKRLK
ncbi:MAG: tetratricopeptide repeat protein [bacterium]